MSYRVRVIALGVAFGVLLLTYVTGLVVAPRPGASAREALLEAFDPATVESVSITNEDGRVELERNGENWRLVLDGDRYPARDDRIDILLDSIASAQIVRVVTNRQEVHDDLGVGEEGIVISLATTEGSTLLHVGDSSQETGGSYIRIGDEADVLATDTELGFYVGQPYSYFAYLRVFPEDAFGSGVVAMSLNVDLVEEPEVVRTFSYSLELTGTGDSEQWLLSYEDGEVVADTSPVDTLLRATADLVGSGFYRDVDPLSLPTVGTASFTLSDGREYGYVVRQGVGLFAMQGRGPGIQHVDGSSSPIWYEVTMPTLRRLFPEPDTLLPELDDEAAVGAAAESGE